MGGGKDKTAANNLMKQGAATENQQSQRFDTRNQADLGASREKGDTLYGDMYKGYSSLLTPQSFDNGVPGDGGGGSGGGGGGGGGSDPNAGISAEDPRFKEVENLYRNFSQSGGWDPNRVKSMDENIQGFKEMSRTGGVDEEGRRRIRGNGVYDEFQQTGGLSEGDRANIRSRATSVIPAMYRQMGDEANRMSSVQGGYGPGRAAMQSRLARDQASGLSDASRDAELGIMEQVNQGRQWGTEGMTSSEVSLQDLLSRNKLSSLTGASQTEQGLQDSIIRGQQYGISGIGGMAENERQAAIQREMIAAQNRASGAASGAASAALAQRNKEWEAEFGLQRYQTGLEGLGSLYTSSPEEYMRNKSFDLQNRDLTGGLMGQFGGGIKQGAKDGWDIFGDVAGAAAGGVGAYFGSR